MQDTLEKAIAIALKAHMGKTDKGGNPYILHPLRVMLSMDTLEERVIGVMHDVLEDSDISTEQLKGNGFSDEIITALKLLKKLKAESYDEYIDKIKNNSLAKKVKKADLIDNMNTKRLLVLTDEDSIRVKKYKKAYKRLSE